MSGEAFRMFVVAGDGVTMAAEVSAALSKAYDVLDAAGLVTEGRVGICHAAERQGRDPVATAHKLVEFGSMLMSEGS